jgi:hypothetical protein
LPSVAAAAAAVAAAAGAAAAATAGAAVVVVVESTVDLMAIGRSIGEKGGVGDASPSSS